MYNYKFRIDNNGFYEGYGSDGSISMTKTYNLDNLPIGCQHDGSKWVLDEVKFKQIKTIELTEKIENIKKELLDLEGQLKNL